MRLGRNDPCHCGSGKKYKKCCLRLDQNPPNSSGKEEKKLAFDPRDFILEPYRKCPNCQEQAFGVLMISGHGYTRRCRNCWHTSHYGLPEIKKKVIYLDQFAVSNITKALDPESKSHERALEDPFWLQIYAKLDRLKKLQLIICPDSWFHREESLLSGDPPFESLRDLYEHFSNGCTFLDYTTILRWQVRHYFRAYLENDPDRVLVLNAQDVVTGRLHEWEDRFMIAVDSRPTLQPESIRGLREEQHKKLSKVFEGWRADKTSYNQSLTEEAATFGRAMVDVFVEYLHKYLQISQQYPEGQEAANLFAHHLEDVLPPPPADLIFDMLRILREYSIEGLEAWSKVGEYFRSPDLLTVPFIRFSSMLYASLARSAGSGRVKPPSPGTFTDVNAIASLLPYCDAIFVDSEMGGYLGEVPLRDEVARYPVKVYSLRSKDRFLEYLDDIESQAHPIHIATVKEVYGEEWAQPYMQLIINRRRQREGNPT